MITVKGTVDMVPGGTRTEFVRKQYDSDFQLKIGLYARDGALSLPAGTTAAIRGTKPDGNVYSAKAAIDVTKSIVTVVGNKQMTAVAGIVSMELTLSRNGKELNSANFNLRVMRAAMDKNTVASDSVLWEFEEIQNDFDAIIAAGQQYTQYKEALESTAADAAESARAAQAAAEEADGFSARIRKTESTLTQTVRDMEITSAGLIYLLNENRTRIAGPYHLPITAAGNTAPLPTFEEGDYVEGSVEAKIQTLENLVSNLTTRLATQEALAGSFAQRLDITSAGVYLLNNGQRIAGPYQLASAAGSGSGTWGAAFGIS